MRRWKIALGTAVALGAISVASVHLLDMGNLRLSASTAGAAPAPAAFVMPVPVASVVKKTIPIYLDYSARTESIRNVSLQAKIAGYVQEQPVTDGADVETGALLYQIDRRDYQAGASSSQDPQPWLPTSALSYHPRSRAR